MEVLIIGNEAQRNELKLKLEHGNHHLSYLDSSEQIQAAEIQQYEIIFDLNFNGSTEVLREYAQTHNRAIILNMACFSFAQFNEILINTKSKFVGMNAIPSFINKPIAEITLLKADDLSFATGLFQKCNYEIKLVNDRVGMIMPRIVCMIINEACYTLQEGTANIKDINLAMKLGTNYPYGPFEWCNLMGIDFVYQLLHAVYQDTYDERYKICPLLKTKFLLKEKFEL